MKCPRCKTADLKPTMIEEQLPALGCVNCQGSLVSLVYYRHWAETQKPAQPEPPAESASAVPTTDTTTAITCPKCGRLMTKHKLAGSVANRVDVCGSCDEAWLDRGEWELLEALQLSRSMPSIFTDQWQRRIRREMSDDVRRSILKRTIGEDASSKVEEFREWLTQNRHKSQILSYLYRD
jgi:Zn-finger nucleic acid-binding protein